VGAHVVGTIQNPYVNVRRADWSEASPRNSTMSSIGTSPCRLLLQADFEQTTSFLFWNEDDGPSRGQHQSGDD
jgi:hypothetical protein